MEAAEYLDNPTSVTLERGEEAPTALRSRELSENSEIVVSNSRMIAYNVIRLQSLISVRNRHLALLEMATTVDEILNIERELERINMQIELMQGRIKHAEQSVDYSHITVKFREKVKPGPVGWVLYGLFYGVWRLFVWD